MNVLSIAGSDPSASAGIQGDVKTFAALGVHGLTVITALTSQNTSKFFTVNPVSPLTVKDQLKSVLSDFKIDSIKIGMVYDSQIIKVIYNELKHTTVPIILDPIFVSTTGGKLLLDDAYTNFKKFLMPLTYVITPNIPEAERMTKMQVRSMADLKKSARKIREMGPKSVVIKGGHVKAFKVTDLLLEGHRFHFFSNKRIKRENHGGGCVFSAALCVALARKKPLAQAVRFAQQISFESIKNSTKIGRGLAVVTQKNTDMIENDLDEVINKFTNIKEIYQLIPECQTNFVYSKPRPNSTIDILGLEGRIVKTGESVTVAGDLKYGGSKHVASAVLEISRKFPSVRSALNVKYNGKIIERAIARRFCVSSYDRRFESFKDKKKEGTTISWGIRDAIKTANIPPDIIYHKGDFGKEPMILIFGKTPSQVLAKLVKIMR
ncbi:MAG: bifunctional hydroxymethylpyrimidine kinase/phosphomethylpyrimidine kinase [Nitrosotalea sp.]